MVDALEEKAQHLLKAFPCLWHHTYTSMAWPQQPLGTHVLSRLPGATRTETPASCSSLQGSVQTHLPEEEEGKQEREASPHPGLEALCKGGRFAWTPRACCLGSWMVPALELGGREG